jgi:hypothetical protein
MTDFRAQITNYSRNENCDIVVQTDTNSRETLLEPNGGFYFVRSGHHSLRAFQLLQQFLFVNPNLEDQEALSMSPFHISKTSAVHKTAFSIGRVTTELRIFLQLVLRVWRQRVLLASIRDFVICFQELLMRVHTVSQTPLSKCVFWIPFATSPGTSTLMHIITGKPTLKIGVLLFLSWSMEMVGEIKRSLSKVPDFGFSPTI